MAYDQGNQACIECLKRRPDLKDFQGDQDAVQKIVKMQNSHVYGGSCFLPIGEKEEDIRSKKNPLLEEIKDFNVEVLYLGGFKDLQHVKVHKHEGCMDQEGALYCHVQLLVGSVQIQSERSALMRAEGTTI